MHRVKINKTTDGCCSQSQERKLASVVADKGPHNTQPQSSSSSLFCPQLSLSLSRTLYLLTLLSLAFSFFSFLVHLIPASVTCDPHPHPQPPLFFFLFLFMKFLHQTKSSKVRQEVMKKEFASLLCLVSSAAESQSESV